MRPLKIKPWFFIICIIIFTVIIRGYHYSKGEMNFYLPMIKRLLAPGFLTRDWFLNLTPYHQNIFWIIGKISILWGLPATILVFHLLTASLYLVATYLITQELTKNKNISQITVFILGLVIPCGLGGYFIFTDYFIPGVLAYGIILFSLYYFIKEKYLFSFVLAFIAGKIHFLAGLNWLLIIGPYYFYSVIKTKKYKEFGLISILFLIIFFPDMLPLFNLQHTSAGLEQAFILINANLRYPHHYLLTAHGFINILFFVIFILFIHRQAKLIFNKKASQKIIYLTFCLTIFMLINLLFVDLWPVVFIAKLQLLRLTFLIEYLFIIIVILSAGPIIWPLLLVLPALVYFFPEHTIHTTCLLIILIYALLRIKNNKKHIKIDPKYILLIMLIFLLVLNKNIFQKVSINLPNNSDPWVDICYQAKSLTPADSLFLVPPDCEGFQLLAERAIVVDFKACPYLEKDTTSWLARLNDISNIKSVSASQRGFTLLPIIAGNYDRLTWSNILNLKNKYQADFIITRSLHPGQKPLYNNRRYNLYPLN